MQELKVHVHRDDYHATLTSRQEDAAHAQARIVEYLNDEYDITSVTFGGERWEHYNYGAQWGPQRKTGWQACSACGTRHPVSSEC